MYLGTRFRTAAELPEVLVFSLRNEYSQCIQSGVETNVRY